MDGERKLACAVIETAINDFKRHSKRQSPQDDDECYLFLTGKTEISRLWFQCANV